MATSHRESAPLRGRSMVLLRWMVAAVMNLDASGCGGAERSPGVRLGRRFGRGGT